MGPAVLKLLKAALDEFLPAIQFILSQGNSKLMGEQQFSTNAYKLNPKTTNIDGKSRFNYSQMQVMTVVVPLLSNFNPIFER